MILASGEADTFFRRKATASTPAAVQCRGDAFSGHCGAIELRLFGGCIFCGYCEEACPVSAVFMGKDYELAVYSSKDFVWDKKDMLIPLTPEQEQAATRYVAAQQVAASPTAAASATDPRLTDVAP